MSELFMDSHKDTVLLPGVTGMRSRLLWERISWEAMMSASWQWDGLGVSYEQLRRNDHE